MQNKEKYSFNPAHLEKLGLFRQGEHEDEHIWAISPDGQRVELEVTPLKIGTGTMFVPKSGQSESLRLLFPRSRWNI